MFKRDVPGCGCCEVDCETDGETFGTGNPPFNGITESLWDISGDWSDQDPSWPGHAFGSSGTMLWKNRWEHSRRTVSISAEWQPVSTRLVAYQSVNLQALLQYESIGLVIDYVDASTYHLVTFDLPANEVRISAVVSGVESVLLTAQLFIAWYSFNPAHPARPGECWESPITVSARVDYDAGLVIARATVPPGGDGLAADVREIAAGRGFAPRGTRAGLRATEPTPVQSVAVGTCAAPYSPARACGGCDPADPNVRPANATVVLSGLTGDWAIFNGSYALPFAPRSGIGGYGSLWNGCGITSSPFSPVSWICGWAHNETVDPDWAATITLAAPVRDPLVIVAILQRVTPTASPLQTVALRFDASSGAIACSGPLTLTLPGSVCGPNNPGGSPTLEFTL